MKTGVLSATVLAMLAVQQASAAYYNNCVGGRCGYQSGSSQGYHQGYRPHYSQNRYQNHQYQGNNYNSRFGGARSPYGPSRFGPSSSQFSSSSSQFGGSPSHFSSSSRSHFSSPSNHFGSGLRHFGSSSSQFGSPSGQFGSFSSSRFGPHQSSFQSRFASTTPDQRYQAQLATNRQLSQRRHTEQQLLRTGSGFVQPGTPSAALANEKRADPKSLALGNQALEQILYLQNLVGSGRRR